MESVWFKGAKIHEFPKLEGDITTNVLVIGGGIAGILCGYMLKQSGVDCIICESDRILRGVTANTTAKITYQHGAIFDKMINRFGLEYAKMYIESQERAIKRYRDLSADIDCDFEQKASVVYSLYDKEKMEKEANALNKLGAECEYCEKLPLPFGIAASVRVKNQAQFNVIKFAYEISKNLKIFENTRIFEVRGKTAFYDGGKIKAEKIIVATHFPFLNKRGSFFLKMYQHRSYVLALKNAPDHPDMYVDENDKGMSFRNYKDMLLLGGGGHRTGKQGGSYKELENFKKICYKKARIISRFATQDCITLDDVAYIGKYSKNTPNLYVATGFNKWGMTNSFVAAEILCDMILGRDNAYKDIYSPQRAVIRPQLFINVAESTLGLITPKAPRCPHLGCALNYNKAEHSWDCSCHGSRFSKSGKLLDNPATKDKIF